MFASMIFSKNIFQHTLVYLYWKLKLGSFGIRSLIIKPLRIDGGDNIFIGKRVVIEQGTWLASMPLTDTKTPRLEISDDCVIGHFNHIYATHEIIIEDGVLTADRVYISDNLHSYQEIDSYIKDQPILQNGSVRIGAGSWLGENVCVLGAKVGKHCIIGSNAVVTRDIPDYSVAVGIPAKVIKVYDFHTKQWKKI